MRRTIRSARFEHTIRVCISVFLAVALACMGAGVAESRTAWAQDEEQPSSGRLSGFGDAPAQHDSKQQADDSVGDAGCDDQGDGAPGDAAKDIAADTTAEGDSSQNDRGEGAEAQASDTESAEANAGIENSDPAGENAADTIDASNSSAALGVDSPQEDTAAMPLMLRSLERSTPAGDVTNNRDQLGLGVVTFSYTDITGATRSILGVDNPSTGHIEYDFSDIPLASIDRMTMEVDFSIKKNDATRTIAAGDTFHYRVPHLFTVADNLTPQNIFAPSGELLATYTIEGNQVMVEFAKAVNLDEGNVDIVGGVSCSFDVNEAALKDDAPTSEDLVLQTGGTTYTFTAPKKGSTVSGIQKTGQFNKDDASVSWTITVGSDPASAGVPLAGITVRDTYDATRLLGAKAFGPGGDELATTPETGGFSYQFPAGSTAVAPYTLTVKTVVAGEVLKQSGDGVDVQRVSNTVTMSSPAASSVVVVGPPDATATVDVPKLALSKQGTQLSSSSMAWQLTVNEGGAGAANNVVVYDRLDARAELIAGSLTVDGAAVAVNPNPEPADAPYAVVTQETAGTALIAVHFPGMVSTERHIAFDTNIDVAAQQNVDIEFPNTAWLTYDWPSADGRGPVASSTERNPLSVNSQFQVAYVNKDTPSYNEHTGVIEWSIKPSTRTDEYAKGVITDTVSPDQEFIDGSVTVKNKGATLSAAELATVFNYDAAAKQLRFEFPHPQYTLNDVEITYQSQALNFQRENMTEHLYENAAHLDVFAASENPAKFQADDTAARSFKNEFLAKTSDYTVVDDASGSTGYVHYRIVANGSQMPCTSLTVEDDLKTLKATAEAAGSGASQALQSSDFELASDSAHAIKVTQTKGAAETDVTNASDVSQWKADRKIAFTAPDSTAAYAIDLYLTLKKDVLKQLEQAFDGVFSIEMENIATASAPEFNNNAPVQVTCTGSAGSGGIGEQLVDKSADGSHLKDANDPYLEYRININPNGAPLEGAVLTDLFDPALSIEVDSVKLYRAQRDSGGAIASALGAEVTGGWSKRLAYDADEARTTLRVELPPGTLPYVLIYRARVVTPVAGGTVQNEARLSTTNGPTGTDVCEAEVDADSWGWLDKKAIYKFVKADEFGDKSLPLAGLTFELYSDAACTTLVATAVSNAHGVVAFYGLDPHTTYYFKETAAPAGYELLTYDAATCTFTTGDAGASVLASKAVKNVRSTSTVPVSITKMFKEATGTIANPQATFKLYLYPKGFGNGKRVSVLVTGSDGAYRYAAGAGAGTTDELQSKAADGALVISGLPWGDYGLEEVATQDGYACFKGARRFSVAAPAVPGGAWSVNYVPTGDAAQDVGAAASIENKKTAISVKKTTDASKDLAGAVLSVYVCDPSGNKSTTRAENPFTGGEFTTTVPSGHEYTWDLSGIPAGTYWLSEDAVPTDATVGRFQDVKFKVDRYGALTVLAGGGTASGGTISVVDEAIQVKVKKLDQWGAGVAGTTLQLQVKDGGGLWSDVAGSTWTTTSESEARNGHVFDGLERGKTYRIVETAVPSGYAAASHPASGARQMVEFTIDEYGKVTSENLHNGSAPAYSASHGTFQNEYARNTFVLRNERIVGHVEFTKYDVTQQNGANKTLSGVEFDLYQKGAGSGGSDLKVNVRETFKSDGNGRVATLASSIVNAITGEPMNHGLTPATYYFQEAATHGDFVFDPANPPRTAEFTISDTQNRYTWKDDGAFGDAITATAADGGMLTNQPLNATVHLVKKGEGSGAPVLIGATFELRATDGTPIDRQTTAASGTVFTNSVKATDSNGTTPTATSTQDGELIFVNVPAGAYTVVETKPAPGYRLNGITYDVEVAQTAANQVYLVQDGASGIVTNRQTKFALAKVDADDPARPVNDVELSVYAKNAQSPGSELVKWSRDGSGAVSVSVSGPSLSVVGDRIVGLPAGDYVLKETKTPAAYVKAADVPFTMKADGMIASTTSDAVSGTAGSNITLTMKNRLAKASVSLTKTIKDGRPGTVEGVEFSLYKLKGARPGADDTLVQSGLRTDASGKLTVANLEVGSYYFKETKATSDTVLNTRPVPFAITNADDGATVSVSVQNQAFAASFEVKKLDAASGTPVAGAAFELSYLPEGGASSQTIVLPAALGETGVYRADHLKKGAYTIRETSVPNGYEAPFEGTFTLVDADNGKTVQVAQDASAGGVAVTKTSGTWSDKGVTNTRILGSMTLTKHDDAGAALAGAEFTLELQDGTAWKKVGAYATDDSGKLFANNLAWGTYRITETKAAEGFQPGATPPSFTFVIGSDAGTQQHLVWDHGVVTNGKTRVSLEKVDNASPAARLDGAKLKLSGRFADGATEKAWESSADAAQAFEGLLVVGETYTLSETERLANYLALPGAITFKLTTAGTMEFIDNPSFADGSKAAALSPDARTLSVRNVRVLGAVTLLKTDAETHAALSGTTFSLYAQGGTLVREGLVTGNVYDAEDWAATPGEAGRLTVKGLDLGSYYFRETAAAGYQVSDAPVEFTITSENGVQDPSIDLGTIENKPTELAFDKAELFAEGCSDITLGAEDPAATKPLVGAEFTAFKDEGCTQPAQTSDGADAVAVSDAEGRVAFKRLSAAATYWVSETGVPAGRVSDGAVYKAAFAANGALTSFERADAPGAVVTQVVNDVARTDIRLKKVSETDEGKVLPGSTYGLFKRAPTPPGPRFFSRAGISVLAAGASRAAGLELIAKATTDHEGMLVFKGVLMDTEYVIQELIAPDGSLVSENPITLTFALDESGTPTLVAFDDGSGTAEVDEGGTIVWKEPQVMVGFSKLDPQGVLLAGAKLQVVDQAGAVVAGPWVSTQKEYLVEGVLVAGKTYRFQELVPPPGYAKAADVVFAVENPVVGPNEGYMQHVTMTDSLLPANPQPPASNLPGSGALLRTGDPFAQVMYLFGGLAILGVCVAFASCVARRRRAKSSRGLL